MTAILSEYDDFPTIRAFERFRDSGVEMSRQELIEADYGFLDTDLGFSEDVVGDDERRFVTGRNPDSGHETADQMTRLIARRAGP